MFNYISLKDLVKINKDGDCKIQLIARAIAILSTEFLDNVNAEDPLVSEYLPIVLSEITKHTFEYLLSMPLDREEAEYLKRKAMEDKFTKIMEESKIDTEPKH